MSANDTILVVLGYPAGADGRPSPILKTRLDKAIELYRNGVAEKLIVTGAAVENEFVESEVMANYCIEQGIPKENIFVESSAKNTYENARMVRGMMHEHGYNNAIVVTSGFHKMRAEQFFSKQMGNFKVVPAPFPTQFPVLKQWYFTLKEHLIMILFKAGLLNSRYSIQQS